MQRISVELAIIITLAGAAGWQCGQRSAPALQPQLTPSPLQRLEKCQANLREIGVRLELYAVENRGSYPDFGLPALAQPPSDLNELPLRLELEKAASLRTSFPKGFPVCPAGGSYRLGTTPKAFRVCCVGGRHAEAGVTGPDLPQFDSRVGLDERLTRQ